MKEIKPKLHFTIKMAKKLKACEEGLDMLYKYLSDNNIKYDEDTKFNVLLLLKSNNVLHLFWLLKRGSYECKNVFVEIANRCVMRTKEYADAHAVAYYAAACSAAFAANAACTAYDAANAAYAAAYAADAADSEREKQVEDFRELLDDGDIE